MSGSYYSQSQQDQIIHQRYFKSTRDGVFIDVGAHNGIKFSNTYFFEKELNWQGICIEPNPEVFQELIQNRKCKCVEGCISDTSEDSLFYQIDSHEKSLEMLSGLAKSYHPFHLIRTMSLLAKIEKEMNVVQVKCYLLNDLFEQNQIDHVQMLSIDTEGGELGILKSIDYSRYKIDVIVVENNFNDPQFAEFLEEKGFRFVQQTQDDQLFENRTSWIDSF